MFARFEQFSGLGYAKLLKGYVETGKRLLELDRAYAREEGLRLFKTYRPAMFKLGLALICLLGAFVLLLATVMMALSIWLKPWAAGLLLLAVLLAAGLWLGLPAARALKVGLTEARLVVVKLKEDVTCFSKN